MFVIKKNQVIIVALVCMIALAGYLNYVDTGSNNSRYVMQEELKAKDLENLNNPNFEKGTKTENNALSPETGKDLKKTETASSNEIGSAVFVDNSFKEEAKETFFLQAKMNREQTRSQRKEWLTDVINNDNVPSTKKTEATDELLTLQKRIELENAIESMIEAKGFEEVYVRIDADSIDVVIDTDGLSQQQISQVAEVVNRKTGYPISKIKINPLKTN